MKTVFRCPSCSQLAFSTSTNGDHWKACPTCGEMMEILNYKYEPAEREWLANLNSYRSHEGEV